MEDKEFLDYLEKVTNLIESNNKYDYRKHAFEELEEIEKATGKVFPNIAFILDQYPDFNTVQLKVTQPNHFVWSICVNPEDYINLEPEKKKQAIHDLVMMVYSFSSMGELKEE